MGSKFSKAEWDAMDKKIEHPESVVYCPRCGKELAFRSVSNSYEVKCPTENCIKETVRGL